MSSYRTTWTLIWLLTAIVYIPFRILLLEFKRIDYAVTAFIMIGPEIPFHVGLQDPCMLLAVKFQPRNPILETAIHTVMPSTGRFTVQSHIKFFLAIAAHCKS